MAKVNVNSLIKRILGEELMCLIAAVTDTSTITSVLEKINIIHGLLKKYGVRFDSLGGATNRTVIATAGYVFKIALDKQGYRDNLIEYCIADDLILADNSKEPRYMVAKPYETNGYITVAETVKVMDMQTLRMSTHDMNKILGQLSQDYLFGDIGRIEKNAGNWGVRDNGEVVILDYAYLHKIDRKVSSEIDNILFNISGNIHGADDPEELSKRPKYERELYECPICKNTPDSFEGILTYDSTFTYMKCNNPECGETFTYMQMKNMMGYEGDLELIEQKTTESLKVPKGQQFITVNSSGTFLHEEGSIVIRSTEDYVEWKQSMIDAERKRRKEEINMLREVERPERMKKMIEATKIYRETGEVPKISESKPMPTEFDESKLVFDGITKDQIESDLKWKAKFEQHDREREEREAEEAERLANRTPAEIWLEKRNIRRAEMTKHYEMMQRLLDGEEEPEVIDVEPIINEESDDDYNGDYYENDDQCNYGTPYDEEDPNKIVELDIHDVLGIDKTITSDSELNAEVGRKLRNLNELNQVAMNLDVSIDDDNIDWDERRRIAREKSGLAEWGLAHELTDEERRKYARNESFDNDFIARTGTEEFGDIDLVTELDKLERYFQSWYDKPAQPPATQKVTPVNKPKSEKIVEPVKVVEEDDKELEDKVTPVIEPSDEVIEPVKVVEEDDKELEDKVTPVIEPSDEVIESVNEQKEETTSETSSESDDEVIESVNEQKEETTSETSSESDDIKSLREEFNAMKTMMTEEISSLKEEIETLKEENRSLRKELEEFKNKNANLTDKNSQLVEENEQLKEENKKLKEENDRLNKLITELKNNIKLNKEVEIDDEFDEEGVEIDDEFDDDEVEIDDEFDEEGVELTEIERKYRLPHEEYVEFDDFDFGPYEEELQELKQNRPSLVYGRMRCIYNAYISDIEFLEDLPDINRRKAEEWAEKDMDRPVVRFMVNEQKEHWANFVQQRIDWIREKREFRKNWRKYS